jgi:hypothetical protein
VIFPIPTTILEHWIFETAMCKIFFVLYSINFITSVFTLTALSGDRYLAVCHPIRSGNTEIIDTGIANPRRNVYQVNALSGGIS